MGEEKKKGMDRQKKRWYRHTKVEEGKRERKVHSQTQTELSRKGILTKKYSNSQAKGEGTYGYSAREREGDIERKGEGDINRESKQKERGMEIKRMNEGERRRQREKGGERQRERERDRARET